MEPQDERDVEGLAAPVKVPKRWYRISRAEDAPGPKLLKVAGLGRSFELERGGAPVLQRLHPERDEVFLREMRERYDVEELTDQEAGDALAAPVALDSGEGVPEGQAIELRKLAQGESLKEAERIDLSGPGPVTVPVEVETVPPSPVVEPDPRRLRRKTTEG